MLSPVDTIAPWADVIDSSSTSTDYDETPIASSPDIFHETPSTDHDFSPSPDIDTIDRRLRHDIDPFNNGNRYVSARKRSYDNFRGRLGINRPKKAKPKNTFPHLTTWLNISKLLDELNEHQWISNHALRVIIQTVFLSTKEFITSLREHNGLTRRQLNTIYDTLKNDMLYNDDCAHSKSTPKLMSSFNALSIPSITNICSYLTKEDILSFKNTSINIAIIALHEMSKYHIGVFNMNQLFHHFNNFSVLKHIKTCDVIQSERYPPSMTFKKIIEVWSKHYDINPRNMVLLYNQSTCARYGRDDWGMGMELKMGWSGSPVSLDSSLRKPLIQFMLGEGASKCSVMTKQRDISDFRIKQMERDRFDYFFVLDKTKMS
eukprot:264428_1